MKTEELLKILVCPACHEDLRLEERADHSSGLYCAHCDLLYPIEEDIPVMLIEKALPLSTWLKAGMSS